MFSLEVVFWVDPQSALTARPLAWRRGAGLSEAEGSSSPSCLHLCVVQIPVVGINAEGGGMRAMISLYGHLLALQKLGLLDCVTYFSGISGSTW